MSTTCCAQGCTTILKSNPVNFYAFPDDPQHVNFILSNIGRNDLSGLPLNKLVENYFICYLHFETFESDRNPHPSAQIQQQNEVGKYHVKNTQRVQDQANFNHNNLTSSPINQSNRHTVIIPDHVFLKCDLCSVGPVYRDLAGHQKHMTEKHRDFYCGLCNRTFKSKYYLIPHQNKFCPHREDKGLGVRVKPNPEECYKEQ